ncbi:methylated-DNA--[protein]-cysteine S-methyltransferase [Flavobacterium sp. ASW18X]|uniref:methylated-DNA--[protein]-cysteine S-methyltransferase n=1 Tax=Flavobacterium sp. ASW18X TaxID=2572595 RepID=UPI0010AE09AD|nr:methylated-DNA--[protein]-cysteine S-methyltransferase [Flavobacterium sp. ASW18X]TKD65010.1 methylated-DNA--[protein]-cysteine S-methyltransferase [Flavobacterium sp. ASW18X]
METAVIKTPIGYAEFKGDEQGLAAVKVLDTATVTVIPTVLQEAANQVLAYFEGSRTTFDLKLNPQGTAFQKKVWQALLKIPYGTTTSYLELSKTLGDVKAIRAVAAANGKNPLWIVVPCHRVIGSNGELTGYAGGLSRKKWLLDHESPVKQGKLF